jgi:hypothetical protein
MIFVSKKSEIFSFFSKNTRRNHVILLPLSTLIYAKDSRYCMEIGNISSNLGVSEQLA